MRNIKSTAGLSLIEILLSLGIGTVLSLGTGMLIYQQVAYEKYYRTRNDVRDFERVIKMAVFMNRDSCGDYFENLTYPITAAASQNGAEITILGVRALSQYGNIAAGATVANGEIRVQSVILREGISLGRDGEGRRLYHSNLVIQTMLTATASPISRIRRMEHYMGSPVFALDDAGRVVSCTAATVDTAEDVCDRLSMRGGTSCAQWFDTGPPTGVSGCGAQNPYVTGVVRTDASAQDPMSAALNCNEPFSTACRGETYINGVGNNWLQSTCNPLVPSGTIPRYVIGPVQPSPTTYPAPDCAELAQEEESCIEVVNGWLGKIFNLNAAYCRASSLAACTQGPTPTPVTALSPTVDPRLPAGDTRCQCGSVLINSGQSCERCHMSVTRTHTFEQSIPVRTTYRCNNGNLALASGGGSADEQTDNSLTCESRYRVF